MESPYVSPPHHADASRPSLGFPLGTALLLLIIFTLSGVFSCCYHWDKLRSLRRSYADGTDPEGDPEQPRLKPRTGNSDSNILVVESLPVLMPGDVVPKFIALPCPCEPLKEEKIVPMAPEPAPKLPIVIDS